MIASNQGTSGRSSADLCKMNSQSAANTLALENDCNVNINNEDCTSLYYLLNVESKDGTLKQPRDIGSGDWKFRINGTHLSKNYLSIRDDSFDFAYYADALEIYTTDSNPKPIILGVIYGNDWSGDKIFANKSINFERIIQISNNKNITSIMVRFIRRCARIGDFSKDHFNELPSVKSNYVIESIDFMKQP